MHDAARWPWFSGVHRLGRVAVVALLVSGPAMGWAQARADHAQARVHDAGDASTPLASMSDLFAPIDPSEPDASGLGRDGATRPAKPRRPLVSDIAHDFARFFGSRETYELLGYGLAGSLSVKALDRPIATSHFNRELFEGGFVDDAFEPGKILGSAAVQIGSAAAVYGIGKLSRHPALAALGRDLVRAQMLTQGVTQLIKYSVRRQRPDGSGRSSFPSGHVSGTFATATVLHRHYGWKAGVPAFGVASYVAASRVNENRHFLSDLILGAAIGLAAGRSVTFDRGSTRFELAPAIVPGGVAAQVSVGTRAPR